MKNLKEIFNNISGHLRNLRQNHGTVEIAQADLAEIIRPFLKGNILFPKLRHIEQGWNELQDWTTIGWEAERTNRGEAATALCHALKMIGQDIRKQREGGLSDDAPLRLSKKDLQVLHATSFQMRAAANYLENVFAKMEKGPVYLQRTQFGIVQTFVDVSNTIPLWCRPNDDHAAMAVALRDASEACDRILNKNTVARAHNRMVRAYIPPKF